MVSRLKSGVWQHFLKESKTHVRCKHCTSLLSHNGNTTNLWNHLKTKHGIKGTQTMKRTASKNVGGIAQTENINPDDPVIAVPESSRQSPDRQSSSLSSNTIRNKERDSLGQLPHKRLCTLSETFKRASSFSDGGVRSAELNEALIFMVCKDHMPLCTPDRSGFRYFAKKAVPLWKPPSRQMLTLLIENKFDVLKKRVIEKISDARNYTITTDAWTDSNTSKGYLGLTLHYLSEKKIESATFGVEPLTEAHVSAYLADRIKKICSEWNIDVTKVNAVVTDNAENIVKAVKDVFGPAKHIPCFAHTLNLIPYAAMGRNSKNDENVPGVPRLLCKVKAIVTFFKRSVKASDELRRLQYANGKTEGTALRLLQDVPTRWNSTYLMLQRFLILSDLIGISLLKFPQGPPMLTGAEIASLEVIKRILAPLMQATVELSAEKTPTTSKVIPITHLMRQMIAMIEPASNDQMSKKLKDFILEGLDRRFGKAEQMKRLAMATMLDPRFKKLHFQSPITASQTITSLSVAVNEAIHARTAQACAPNMMLSTAAHHTDPNDMWSLDDNLLSVNSPQEVDTTGGVPAELRQYLNTPVISRQTDPFEAWDTLKAEYPHVFEVALDYLPTLATSVPSERLFSEAGLVAQQSCETASQEVIFLSSCFLHRSVSASGQNSISKQAVTYEAYQKYQLVRKKYLYCKA